jgi:uncharacterized protein (DUF433 family)
MKSEQIYLERIVQDPEILAGKPTIRGTRVPVDLILGKLAYNTDVQELFLDYPHLTLDDIRAVLLYAQSLVQRVPKARSSKAS